jgi:hypothetical protein
LSRRAASGQRTEGFPVEIGANNANACAGSTVGNNLHVHNNSAATSIDYNSVSGNLQIHNDTPRLTFPAIWSATTCYAKTPRR